MQRHIMEEKTHGEVIKIDGDEGDYVKALNVHMDKAITKASSKDVIVIPDGDEESDHASGAVTHRTLIVYIQSREEVHDRREKKH